MAFILASFMFAETPAHADDSDYWLVRVSDNHALFYFIDAATITYDGPFRSVWMTQVIAGKGTAKHDIRRIMTLTMLDCPRNSSHEGRVVTYDRQGDTLSDHLHDRDNYKEILPESIDAVEKEFVCANPGTWPLRKGWTEISTTPEKSADSDNRVFQTRLAP